MTYPAWNWIGFVAFAVPVVLTLLSLGSNAFSWFCRLRLVYRFGVGRVVYRPCAACVPRSRWWRVDSAA